MIPAADLPAEIKAACDAFEATRARELAEQLARAIRTSGARYPADQALRALKPLRRKRYFDAALLLGDAIFESGQHEPLVQLVYAQALIDSGRLAAAIPFVQELVEVAPPRSHVSNEARGLLGRAYKQWYANGAGESAARTNHLVRAFNAYYDAYLENPKLSWHGINAVAILARASMDQLTFPEIATPAQTLYEQMRAAVAGGKPTVWDLATAAESALAVNRPDEATMWYDALTRHEDADAFEIGSALRQLEEIWRLPDDTPPGSQILPLLRARLLQAQGGAVSLRRDELAQELRGSSSAALEAIFGDEGAKAISWYRLGLERCLPVARIETAAGSPHGTGFVVRGRDLHPRLGEERVVLTNHHVISGEHSMSLAAADAQLRFHAAEKERDRNRRYTLEMLWTSPSLDATLLRITPEPPESFDVYPVASALPKVVFDDAGKPKTRVYVIGHPRGGEMSVSLYDNGLLDRDERRLHYRAPTQPGSSGSPVFNDAWQLIGLHHAGGTLQKVSAKTERHEANEAFSIDAIRAATRRQSFPARRRAATGREAKRR